MRICQRLQIKVVDYALDFVCDGCTKWGREQLFAADEGDGEEHFGVPDGDYIGVFVGVERQMVLIEKMLEKYGSL